MSYLLHPWLLVAGVCAVSLPVLIHLLNRRRFRIVDWAAMEFLLQADKESRRRIRLQHWLLLFLRSLAIALIGLLLARPLLPSNFASGLSPAAKIERIIVLDDSLSMQARGGNESAWERGKRTAVNLVRRLMAQHGGNDTLTLIVTSNPNQLIIAGAALTNAGVEACESRLTELDCSDRAVRLPASLQQLALSLRSQDRGVSRAVYVLTDMREPDWPGSGATVASLRDLSELVEACFLVDVGDEHDANLMVAKVQSDAPIVSDLRAALDVTVTNRGTANSTNIAVTLFVGDGLPAAETIEQLAAGESTVVRFYPTFTCEQLQGGPHNNAPRFVSQRVRVALKAENATDDLLAADSAFYFPAHIRCGLRVLVVDGDPSPEFGKSESFYLQRALAPAGPVKSGVLLKVVNEDELHSAAFSEHDVIFLLNGSQRSMTSENLSRLKQWVASGGGLVLMPGDQTDQQWFNRHMYENGQGLSPLKLLAITPDEGDASWTTLQLIENNRLLPRLAAEPAFVENVKIWRHWQAAVPPDDAKDTANVVATLSDGSPAIAEKSFGAGRVVAFAIPADADWHNWPSTPSFVLMVQELVHALIANDSANEHLTVGGTIHQSIDIARYDTDAVFEDPAGNQVHLQATAKGGGQDQETNWEFVLPATRHLGFSTLTLSRRDGGHEPLLFAANADATEADLKRADLDAIRPALAGLNVRIVSADDAGSFADQGAERELWRYFAWLLAVVLASEQLLGWFFGRQRT
ncbi:MAG TPA: BatA domain-containing protein [Pirellulaceae bacterium]|jgi:hypothetical protein